MPCSTAPKKLSTARTIMRVRDEDDQHREEPGHRTQGAGRQLDQYAGQIARQATAGIPFMR